MKTVIAIVAVVFAVCVATGLRATGLLRCTTVLLRASEYVRSADLHSSSCSQRQGGQQQQANQAIIPRAVDRMGDLGSYLWSYMPAPVRGADSPYAVPPGSGQVNVNFVPGSP